jgi:flagellar M-ring protein FliF
VNGFVNFVKTLGVGRIAGLAATCAAIIAFFLFLSMRISEPKLAPLYGKLEQSDAAAIVGKLDALKIPYELKGDGTLVLVPEDRVLKLRMSLAEQGLPSGGSAGYELFDKQDNFSATSFSQDMNKLRALEGELARTIRSIDTIEAARVHLVMPKRELFASDRIEPTASIVLRTRRGGLGHGQVKAIQNLVASAVEGLTPGRVTIIDEEGRLLAAASDNSDPEAAQTTAIDERTASYENRVRGDIEEIVARIVGPGRARVRVSADMDYDRVTQSAESYDPDGQVVRSTQTVDEKSASQDGEQQEGVSVAAKLPDGQAPVDGTKTSNKQSTNRTEETVNYDISKTTKTEVKEYGRVKRLSVAVLVDGAYTADKDGKKTYAPRSQDELDKITTLVRSAMGYSEKRGDEVTVVNLPFANADTDEALIAEAKPFLGLETADMIRIGETVGLIVVALLMIFFVLRPMIGRLTGIAAGAGAGGPYPALPAGGAQQLQSAGAPGQAMALQGHGPSAATHAVSGPGHAPLALPRQSHVANMIDLAQVEGQVKESSIRKVGEIINNHPEEAVSILRNWLYQAE